MKLDLGGTACYESKQAVGISDDGTTAGDEVTPHIVGDYNQMPFPNAVFDEAHGSCYLEDPVNWHELARVLKPGAPVYVSACAELYDTETIVVEELREAGFVVVEPIVWVEPTDDWPERYPDRGLVLRYDPNS